MRQQKENLQTLITERNRRLQVLKKEQARKGVNTPPEIFLEIEDIENELASLVTELATYRAPTESAFPEAPLIHIHNWTTRIDKSPETVEFLNWHGLGKFEERPDKTRDIPLPEVWEKELMPELTALPDKVEKAGLVRLEGRCALSTGFAFGHIFKAKDRYQIEVAQYVPQWGHTEYWYSSAQPPKNVAPPGFTSTLVQSTTTNEESETKNDGVIVVNALTGKLSQGILHDVGLYFGEPEEFSQVLGDHIQLQTVKGVLVLEAEAATQENRPLEGWEAASLAHKSRQMITDFEQQVNPQKLHLFLATPLGLAVFLGHAWNNIHLRVQCYEEVRHDGFYVPSCTFMLE